MGSEGKKTLNPGIASNFQNEYSKQAQLAIDNDDEQFFQFMKAFFASNYTQKAEFIEKVLHVVVKKPDLGTFIVGQVFQQRGEGLVQQRYQPNFKNLIWEHAQGRTVEINAFGKYLKEYIPEDNLTDTRIEHKTNSDCMSEDAFWALMYVLIIKPEMGKEMFKYELNKSSNYFFLVRMGSKSTFYKAFHVHLRWSARDSEWVFDASSFNSSAQITWGHVYLYPDPDDGSLS